MQLNDFLHQILLVNPEIVNALEAQWIVQRLCELLAWEMAELPLVLKRLLEEFLQEPKEEAPT